MDHDASNKNSIDIRQNLSDELASDSPIKTKMNWRTSIRRSNSSYITIFVHTVWMIEWNVHSHINVKHWEVSFKTNLVYEYKLY